MDKHASAKNYADNVIKKYRLSSPTLDQLAVVSKELGYELIDYGKQSNGGGVSALIQELKVQRYIDTCSAFTYQNGDIKIVFICEALTEAEKRYALAHELGHIICGHMEYNRCSSDGMEDEYEANEFAHYLLHPQTHQKLCSYVVAKKGMVLATVIIAIIAVFGVMLAFRTTQDHIYHGEYYVTSSGHKYHTKDCFTIARSPSVHRMTEKEYGEGHYTACDLCLPKE